MLSTVFSFACEKCVTHTAVKCRSHSGGYCGGVPPLPIPNREVKPTYADGTAMQCGRVGSRLLFTRSLESRSFQGSSFFAALVIVAIEAIVAIVAIVSIVAIVPIVSIVSIILRYLTF